MRLETAIVTHASGAGNRGLAPPAAESAEREMPLTRGSMIVGCRDAGAEKALAFAQTQESPPHGPATIVAGGRGYSAVLEHDGKFWMSGSHGCAAEYRNEPWSSGSAIACGVFGSSEVYRDCAENSEPWHIAGEIIRTVA